MKTRKVESLSLLTIRERLTTLSDDELHEVITAANLEHYQREKRNLEIETAARGENIRIKVAQVIGDVDVELDFGKVTLKSKDWVFMFFNDQVSINTGGLYSRYTIDPWEFIHNKCNKNLFKMSTDELKKHQRAIDTAKCFCAHKEMSSLLSRNTIIEVAGVLQ
jgi:hypothetical protein